MTWSPSPPSTTSSREPFAARTRSFASSSTACGCATSAISGKPTLRPEQEQAIGQVDLLFVPVGGGPTVGGESAAAIVRTLGARLVVPMHYRTEAVNFLEPPDAFLEALGAPVERVAGSEVEPQPPLAGDDARVLLLAAPRR